jgi:hypothetical protein
VIGRTALLDYADDVLDGKFSLGRRAPRTAALLARLALEDWLNEQSASWCPVKWEVADDGVETCCSERE